jgi:sugar/nucleoside kinase (ribokinase family)
MNLAYPLRQPSAGSDGVDYLVIGHVSRDITPSGHRLGGTAAYSALTAKALGMQPRVLTSGEQNLSLPELAGIPVHLKESDKTTTFRLTYSPHGRDLYISGRASQLEYTDVPVAWRNPAIVHLGPIAQEIDPNLAREFPNSLVCVTPQGFLRTWDNNGAVTPCEWPEFRFVLGFADLAVLSREDVRHNDDLLDEMASAVKLLVVTDSSSGCSVYWNGDLRRFSPPAVTEVDATGAGDIFTTCFLYRYYTTLDPWESARFATLLAANSVTRSGLAGIPSPDEISSTMVEII